MDDLLSRQHWIDAPKPIAGVERSMTIAKPGGVNEVAFEVELPAVETELQTWLTTPDGKAHGAYFVTVERLSGRSSEGR